jgi:hypothetical protein
VQNLRQNETYVHEYTEEFFKISLRSGIKEPEYQRVERYVNGLKYQIQNDMSMHYFHNVDEAYQVSLNVEENIDKRLRQKFRKKELEAEEKQVLLKIVKRRMKRPVVRIQEEEEALVEEKVLVKGSMLLLLYMWGRGSQIIESVMSPTS